MAMSNDRVSVTSREQRWPRAGQRCPPVDDGPIHIVDDGHDPRRALSSATSRVSKSSSATGSKMAMSSDRVSVTMPTARSTESMMAITLGAPPAEPRSPSAQRAGLWRPSTRLPRLPRIPEVLQRHQQRLEGHEQRQSLHHNAYRPIHRVNDGHDPRHATRRFSRVPQSGSAPSSKLAMSSDRVSVTSRGQRCP